jgi:hypothetical protein
MSRKEDDNTQNRARVPETPEMGLAYIKVRLATLSVRIQSLLILLKDRDANIDVLRTIIGNINKQGDELYLDPNGKPIPRIQKAINKNKNVRKLFNTYRQGLIIASNELNSM